MFEKLPPKKGLRNRAKRLGAQAIDKVLYPNSNRVLSGGGQSPWSPVTRRELNIVATEYDMRRYPSLGGVLSLMTSADHHAATEAYIGIAKGDLHVLTAEEAG